MTEFTIPEFWRVISGIVRDPKYGADGCTHLLHKERGIVLSFPEVALDLDLAGGEGGSWSSGGKMVAAAVYHESPYSLIWGDVEFFRDNGYAIFFVHPSSPSCTDEVILKRGLSLDCMMDDECWYPMEERGDAMVWGSNVFLSRDHLPDEWELSADLPEGTVIDRDKADADLRGRRVWDYRDDRKQRVVEYFEGILEPPVSDDPLAEYRKLAGGERFKKIWHMPFPGLRLQQLGPMEVVRIQPVEGHSFYCGIIR